MMESEPGAGPLHRLRPKNTGSDRLRHTVEEHLKFYQPRGERMISKKVGGGGVYDFRCKILTPEIYIVEHFQSYSNIPVTFKKIFPSISRKCLVK